MRPRIAATFDLSTRELAEHPSGELLQRRICVAASLSIDESAVMAEFCRAEFAGRA
jgi:hypothetical protein